MALLLGCQKQTTQAPDNLVPQETMVQILADVHIAEALIENRVIYPDTALMTYNQQQQRILASHNVSEEDFRKTYNYYLENLTLMDKLYEVVLDTLSVREAKARAANGLPEENPQPKRSDFKGQPEMAR
ncbi:hypothetical protein OB13_15825 [Pontibacter sp. HJ8]